MGKRRRARELALQVLFHLEFSPDDDPSEAFDLICDSFGAPESVREFARMLIAGVWSKRGELDKVIAQASRNWRIDRMTRVDRSILRMAVFEMMFVPDIPAKVSLDEAVELGKRSTASWITSTIRQSTRISRRLGREKMANNARYNPQELELKWQSFWENNNLFKCKEDTSKEKYYLLEMFPYPSGKIHIGHVRNYTIGDVVARYKRMCGKNVLHPMGWDAFGMPAENAAIENNTHPARWTYDNIAAMKAQLKRMGFSYDWDREVTTCNPDYYRWEQLIFLKMYERGLAYKKKTFVNWCDKCQTVLANEQVEEGCCWRHPDVEVSIKEMDSWFLKITHYAEEILDHCDKLPGWPERVITMQRNWIGKSHGAIIRFPMVQSDEVIEVFTTRQDTLFGATFMCLAPEHPLVKQIVRGRPQEREVLEFADRTLKMDRFLRTAEFTAKEGVFTGRH